MRRRLDRRGEEEPACRIDAARVLCKRPAACAAAFLVIHGACGECAYWAVLGAWFERAAGGCLQLNVAKQNTLYQNTRWIKTRRRCYRQRECAYVAHRSIGGTHFLPSASKYS